MLSPSRFHAWDDAPPPTYHIDEVMLKKAKWVKADQSHLPISRIAAEVIGQRLTAVRRYMPLAADHWRDNVEYVHQLRVATRRASAAIQTFADLTPPRRAEKLNKKLRKLRRAAGEPRDLDVLAARLRDEIEEEGRKSLNNVLAQLAQRREQAQQPLSNLVAKLESKRFKHKCLALVERIRWRLPKAEPTYGEIAGAMLRPPVDEFFAAAEGDLTTTQQLHALRIAGKRLRYTMELLAGAFDDSFRDDLYAEVSKLQDQLGQLNDGAAARARFLHWSELAGGGSARCDLGKLAEQEATALERDTSNFLQQWTEQRREELKQRFRGVKPLE